MKTKLLAFSLAVMSTVPLLASDDDTVTAASIARYVRARNCGICTPGFVPLSSTQADANVLRTHHARRQTASLLASSAARRWQNNRQHDSASPLWRSRHVMREWSFDPRTGVYTILLDVMWRTQPAARCEVGIEGTLHVHADGTFESFDNIRELQSPLPLPPELSVPISRTLAMEPTAQTTGRR